MVHTEEMTVYTANCDKCSKDFEEGDINLFIDRQAMVETAEDYGWIFTEDGCLCDECRGELTGIKN